jgi:hypothetical protein
MDDGWMGARAVKGRRGEARRGEVVGGRWQGGKE